MNLNESKKIKCLIIHGFGGGVHEIKPLDEYLTSLGYKTVCPILKGHSSTKKDMKKATYSEWIDSAEQELLLLKENGDEVIIIGFSMGGLIAFNLACKHNIKGVVTINTPIYFWNINRVFLNLLEDIKNKKCNNIRRYLKAKNNSPFPAMIQFLLLLNQTKRKFENIDCPILTIQAEDDDTVRIKSVNYIYKNISSSKKTIKYFPKGGHLILLSKTAELVMACIEDFLKEK